MSRSKEKLARELPRDACVLAARFPLATWTETRHDVHAVRSRGYNVNQLWEYELDPDLNIRRGDNVPLYPVVVGFSYGLPASGL